MVREGLGYSLRSYDPCFNFNNDNFCCSEGNQRLYNNIALRRARATQAMHHNTYQAPRNYSVADSAVPLWLRETGLKLDTPYTFPSTDSWYVPCSRMPCGIYANKFPCQRE
jgi:hypothetical protein